MSDEVDGEDTGFLKRWSRVKSGAEEQEEIPPVIEANSELQTGDSEEEQSQELAPAPPNSLTDEDMPPIESLHEGSDFSGFLSEGVSAGLRKAAMKKLFAQPAFNIRDGLNDYDEDYTSFKPLGDTVTVEMAYRKDIDAKREAAKKALLEERSTADTVNQGEIVLQAESSAQDDEASDPTDDQAAIVNNSEENPESIQQQNNPDEPNHEHE